MERFDFEDIWFTVVAEEEEYRVSYTLFEIAALGDEISFRSKEDRCGDFTSDIEKAAPFAHGYVKWDGCSNWEFLCDDDAMYHACSREHLINIGEVLARCYDLTAKLCKNWLD